jgi:septum formation protein
VSVAGARLVLASASPRRRRLLRDAGVSFEVIPADVDEWLEPGVAALDAAPLLAERKARAVAGRLALDERDPTLVLGADTVVCVADGEGRERLLGKPSGEEEAAEMLSALSDSRHAVVTGVCVLRLRDGGRWVAAERTWVRMRALLPEEVSAYAASGEWRDKAGGYAIQESADRFVTGLEGGGFDNVVGLPVARTLELLRAAGWGAG